MAAHPMTIRACVILPLLAAVAGPSAGAATFTSGPSARKDDKAVTIRFAVSAPTDVEVAVLDARAQVVRHLAAGVLGKTPPAPFKPGLSQTLTWDGKDDLGGPAKGGPFSVRVRLGLGVKLGAAVGDSPYNFGGILCRGVVTDPANGDVYYMGGRAALRFVRVFDRSGKFLREVLPYPATLPTAERAVFGQIDLPDGRAVPVNYYSLWPVFYSFGRGLGHDDSKRPEGKLAAFNRAAKTLLLLSERPGDAYRLRSADGGAAAGTFAEPLWPKAAKPLPYHLQGPVTAAFSPDGKALYITGLAGNPSKGAKLHPDYPDGRIYKAARDAAGRWVAARFADVPLGPKAPVLKAKWSIGAHSTSLHGIAVGADGRLYVADRSNGKVQVLDQAGKIVASADAPDAYLVALDAKRGAVYVVTRPMVRGRPRVGSLLKITDPGGDAAVAAALKLPNRGASADPFLAGDFAGDVPQLWIGGVPTSGGLLRVVDKGGKLAVAEDLADRAKTAPGFATRMVVDKAADLVYVNDGVFTNLRYNGLTGEYAGKLDSAGRPAPITGSELCVRRDGMIYRLAGKSWKGKIDRLNRDLSPAPLPDGRKQFGFYYGRMGGGYFGNHGWAATPDGRLLAMGMFDWCQYAVFEFSPEGKPTDRPWLKDYQWKGDFAKAGINSVLVGWLPTQCGGVVVGPGGHVYVGLRMLPRDHKLPDALKRGPGYATQIGSVIKFRPGGGAVHPGDGRKGSWKNGPLALKIPDKLAAGLPMGDIRTQHGTRLKSTYVEGAVRAYPGLAPFSGYGRSDACVCQTPRFDVDDYGRIYIPNALTCSVTIVDDAGNAVARFGEYGNFDALKTARGAVPLAYPVAVGVSLKHIYVADSANRRVLRVDYTYAAEKTAAVK